MHLCHHTSWTRASINGSFSNNMNSSFKASLEHHQCPITLRAAWTQAQSFLRPVKATARVWYLRTPAKQIKQLGQVTLRTLKIPITLIKTQMLKQIQIRYIFSNSNSFSNHNQGKKFWTKMIKDRIQVELRMEVGKEDRALLSLKQVEETCYWINPCTASTKAR